MINVAEQVTRGEIPYKSGLEILKTAFKLSDEEAIRIIGENAPIKENLNETT